LVDKGLGCCTYYKCRCNDSIRGFILGDEMKIPKELVDGLTLVLLAEWLAIQDGKTRLQSAEYKEEAQELADYLYTIGYRMVK
jgi:hypothetical protein